MYGVSWFPIDFLSVFPFDMMMSKGTITKLLRLLRLPRLFKILDVSRFKVLIRTFQAKNSDHTAIER